MNQWLTVAITLFLAVMSAATSMVIYTIRGTYRWARAELKLEQLVEEMKRDREATKGAHAQMYSDMQRLYEGMDERVKWLEQHLWRGRGNAA